MNTTKHRIIVSWHPVAAAVCVSLALLGAGSAWAGDEDSPLALTLAQYINRDTNFTRNDADARPEWTSTSVANIGLNKQYGRQTYQGNVKLSAERHHNFSQLNNDGKNANASFTTEMASNWLLSANGQYDESLNAIENNVGSDRLTKNIRRYRDGGFSVQYGNGGTWAVAGSFDTNKQTYTADSQKYQNSKQRTVGVKGIYFSTDLLSYSLGTRRVVTDFPNNTDRYSQVVDRNVDFTVNWQATGLSNLNATVTRRSSSYTPDDFAGSTGWTGSAAWVYTPQGIVSYDLNFSRTTGTDRQAGAVSFFGFAIPAKYNNDTITTSLTAGAHVQATGKINVNLSYSLTNYRVDRVVESQISTDTSPTVSSYNHTGAIGIEYAAMRTLSLGCNWQRYSQAAIEAIGRLKYHGRAYGCNANFTLDSL